MKIDTISSIAAELKERDRQQREQTYLRVSFSLQGIGMYREFCISDSRYPNSPTAPTEAALLRWARALKKKGLDVQIDTWTVTKSKVEESED